MEEKDDYTDRDHVPSWWARRPDLVAIFIALSGIVGALLLIFILRYNVRLS